jgi:hypothetical protein
MISRSPVHGSGPNTDHNSRAVAASRFDGISRIWAVLILALTAALMVVSALFPMTPPNLPTVEVAVSAAAPTSAGALATAEAVVDNNPDLTLYRTIIARVANGDGYYPAIAELHRKGSFPLRPFIVFRLPTLAMVSAAVGMQVANVALWVLLLAVALAWWFRLNRVFDSPPRRIMALVMVVFGLIFNAHPEVVVVHEVWAGLLMALTWAVYRSDVGIPGWLPSVLLGLMAVLVRETALPFVLLMAAFALWRRQWFEVCGWAAVVAIFAAAMVGHADQVAAVTNLTDPASAGWNHFGGWPFFVFAMRRMTQLLMLPTWALVPLILLGWASWRSPTGLFGLMLFCGYGLILMVLGRPENFYWALMVAPTFLLGLAFLPEALAALFAAIAQPSPTAALAPTSVLAIRARRIRSPKLAGFSAK